MLKTKKKEEKEAEKDDSLRNSQASLEQSQDRQGFLLYKIEERH